MERVNRFANHLHNHFCLGSRQQKVKIVKTFSVWCTNCIRTNGLNLTTAAHWTLTYNGKLETLHSNLHVFIVYPIPITRYGAFGTWGAPNIKTNIIIIISRSVSCFTTGSPGLAVLGAADEPLNWLLYNSTVLGLWWPTFRLIFYNDSWSAILVKRRGNYILPLFLPLCIIQVFPIFPLYYFCSDMTLLH